MHIKKAAWRARRCLDAPAQLKGCGSRNSAGPRRCLGVLGNADVAPRPPRGYFVHTVLLRGTPYIPAEFNIYDHQSASLKTLRYLTVGWGEDTKIYREQTFLKHHIQNASRIIHFILNTYCILNLLKYVFNCRLDKFQQSHPCS